MDPELPLEAVRADKWLWAVRLFKTRGEATHACRLNQVRIKGKTVKAGRLLRPGEVLTVEKGLVNRVVRVRRALESRIGARLVDEYLEDMTPPEAWEKARAVREQARANRVYRSEAGGRPSKRDRSRTPP